MSCQCIPYISIYIYICACPRSSRSARFPRKAKLMASSEKSEKRCKNPKPQARDPQNSSAL